MYVGTLRIDVLLGDVRSLKQKRSVVRPVVSELRRRFAVGVSEVGHLDLHRRTEIGVVTTAADPTHCRDVLEKCERAVVARPEIEVLSTRLRLFNEEDM